MLGELIPCGGGDPIPLLKTRLLIGRRSRCDITLSFTNVSSHHCELELVDGFWSVRDLGSRNGVKVNGVRCKTKWLMPGDVVSVAKHRYELIYTPIGDAPPPEEEDPFAIPLLVKAGLMRPQLDETETSSRSSGKAGQAVQASDDDAGLFDWPMEDEDGETNHRHPSSR